ncbi:MAG TPA: hypothetical protein VJ917_03245 [Saprospiraceae bacterium]|nr:hypothetical protein [Saprospiraceae bacterium]
MRQVYIVFYSLIISLGVVACMDEETPNWERNICDALSGEDYLSFQNVCNDFLEQNENENIQTLLEEFTLWLDDMDCLEARIVCFECLPFTPPASEVQIQFSSIETERITKELVVVSFEEAMFIRVSEVR